MVNLIRCLIERSMRLVLIPDFHVSLIEVVVFLFDVYQGN